jgi:hypothetical protein
MAEPPPFQEGILLGYFIVSDDVERSRRFSISGSKTSRPCTPNGAPAVLNS